MSSLSFGFNCLIAAFVDVRLWSLIFHKGNNRSYSTYEFVMFEICITRCIINNNDNKRQYGFTQINKVYLICCGRTCSTAEN